MNFQNLVDNLIDETTQKSLSYFGPELTLCATIVILMLARLFNLDRRFPAYGLTLVGAAVAFLLAAGQVADLREAASFQKEVFFSGMLVYDQLTVFLKVLLLLFLILVIALTVISGIPDEEDGPDFYTLLLGSTIGMMLMVGANHLLILFLGVEMTSVPSYVMVGFLKGRKLSSEAALKYVVYGAGAAGVMLYGVSLIAGLLGTGDLSELAVRLNVLFAGQQAGMTDAMVRTLVLGSMLVMVGLAFKLSLVPFHFWCPDAFEGASAEVAGFLSVAPKAAAFGLLVRFVLALVGDGGGSLADVYVSMGVGLGLMAIVSVTFGNLAAYAQNNMKRLLAYSTIAHAGYMLMAVAAMMVILNSGGDPATVKDKAATCLEGLIFYLAVYLFMNLGAFAIVALIRNQIFSEEIDDYAGVGSQAPLLGICLGFCLFSLVGLPPFGGFFAKLIIFYSLFDAGYVHWSMWAVLAAGGLNTVFSLFYYVRVLKVMFFSPRPEEAPAVEVPWNPVGSYVLLISVPVLLLGIFPSLIVQSANWVAVYLTS